MKADCAIEIMLPEHMDWMAAWIFVASEPQSLPRFAGSDSGSTAASRQAGGVARTLAERVRRVKRSVDFMLAVVEWIGFEDW